MESSNGTRTRRDSGVVDGGLFPNVAWFSAGVCSSGHQMDLEDVQEFRQECSCPAAARLPASSFSFRAVGTQKGFATSTEDRKRGSLDNENCFRIMLVIAAQRAGG